MAIRTAEPTKYKWTGWVRATGAKADGSIEGFDLDDAKDRLRARGIIPEHLTAVSGFVKAITADTRANSKKVKAGELAQFARNWAVTEAAGIPTPKALGMIGSNLGDGTAMGRVVRGVHRDISNGETLSASFAPHERNVGELAVALIAAGEKTSTLDATLLRFADMTERRVRIRRKVMSAMAYPLVVLSLTLLAALGAIMFIIPQFETLFAEFGADKLPMFTRLMITASEVLKKFFFLIPLVPVGAIYGFRKLRRSEKYGERIDKMLFKVPLFGKIAHKTVMARFTDVLAVMLRSGVPTDRALEIAASTAGNAAVAAALRRARMRITQGVRFSEAMSNEPTIPEVIPALIEQGLAAARPEELLARYSEMTEAEVDAKVSSLAELVQPMLMLVIMGIVGMLAAAIYGPVLGLYDQLLKAG